MRVLLALQDPAASQEPWEFQGLMAPQGQRDVLVLQVHMDYQASKEWRVTLECPVKRDPRGPQEPLDLKAHLVHPVHLDHTARTFREKRGTEGQQGKEENQDWQALLGLRDVPVQQGSRAKVVLQAKTGLQDT